MADDMPPDEFFGGGEESNVVPIGNAKRKAKPKADPPPDDAIRLGADVHRVVDQCEELIATDDEIYQRNGTLARVTRTAESEADAMTLEGTPQIRTVQPATLVERLTRLSNFVRFDYRSGRWIDAAPSGTVVAALSARAQWRGVRPLIGVIEAPAMRPDGSIVEVEGYDNATGFYFAPNAAFLPVPSGPSQAHARAALAELAEPFADFPFASDAHQSAMLSAVLTLLARPAIAGNVPAIIIDATTRGTGKTLGADVVSIIATGRQTAKMGYPTNDEELEKVLGAYALRGAALINFDNVTRSFGGGPIDRCLTAGGSVELRILGKTEVPSLPWRALVLATGNNVEVHGDTGRRVLISRLESPIENPEERTGFRHHPLAPWVATERLRLVRAALTILRAYTLAGRPDVGVRTWGSFEEWTGLVASALVFAGAADPLMARASGDDAIDTEKGHLVTLLRGLARLDVGQGVTAKEAIDRLYPSDYLRGHAAPDGNDDIREAIETLTKHPAGKGAPKSSSLGYVLRKTRGRILGGRKLVAPKDRTGTTRWRVQSAGDAGDAGDVPSARGKCVIPITDRSGVNG